MNKIYIGIDVSKDSLDVSTPNEVFKSKNDESGFKSILRIINKLGANLHCVCESTGGYELKLSLFLFANGVTMSVENPAKVKYFKRSLGDKAKTDKLDAECLRLYGERMNPREWRAPTESELERNGLLRRREEYVKTRMQEKNRLSIESNKMLKRNIEKHIKFLDKEILELEAEIESLIISDREMEKKSDIIKGIKGFGKVSAMSLLTYLPELGYLSKGGVAAIVGVAPYNRDSGQKNGKRMIRGGRKILRDKLYMPTLQAMRHNEIIRDYYERLNSKGKPFKVCAIACMRKLLIHINAQISKYIKSQQTSLA